MYCICWCLIVLAQVTHCFRRNSQLTLMGLIFWFGLFVGTAIGCSGLLCQFNLIYLGQTNTSWIYFFLQQQLYIIGCEVFQFLFITSNHWKSLSSFLHLTAACYWGSGQVAPSLSHPKVPPLSFMAQVTAMSVTSLVLSSSHFLQLSRPPFPHFQGSLTAERAEEHTAWHLPWTIDITKPTVGSSYKVQWLIHDPKHWDGGIKM